MANPTTDARHVLYIDDEPILVTVFTRLLERLGHRVSGYTDQHQALAAFRETPAAFDMVLADYHMDGLNGLDVARQVREIRPDVPVVVISGYIDDALKQKAQDAGVQRLIAKTGSPGEMIDELLSRP